jgi:hypothetical protein
MCLNTLLPKEKNEGVGWKVFRINKHGKLEGETVRMYAQSVNRPVGQWLDAREYGIWGQRYLTTDENEHYSVGWHIWSTKEAAQAWIKCPMVYEKQRVIRRVKYKKVLAVGMQNLRKVIVAQFIKIESRRSKEGE